MVRVRVRVRVRVGGFRCGMFCFAWGKEGGVRRGSVRGRGSRALYMFVFRVSVRVSVRSTNTATRS